MIINHSTWKNYITNHPSSLLLDANLASISAAFLTSKTELERMETALRMDPSIFLVLPTETRHPTIVHHITKVFRNIFAADNGDDEFDEFFCLHGWDTRQATAIKITPTIFFASVFEVNRNGEINLENGNMVRKVDPTGLRSALNKESFGLETRMAATETLWIRKCIPVVPSSIASIIESIGDKEPHDMGVILAEKVKMIERDSSHGLHNVVTSQAGKDLINEILVWLYYAPRYPSIRLDCSAAFPGRKIYTAATELHRV